MLTTAALNRIRQITVADDQGYVTSPKSRPRRIINTPPTMSKLPVQSTTLSPARTGVFRVGIFKKKSNTTNTTVLIGRLIQKHHLQSNRVVKTPPNTGPTPLPTAQTIEVMARYNSRSLNKNVS